MLLAVTSVLLVIAQSTTTAPPTRRPTGTEIRTRLDAYEKQVQQTGRPDPAALGEIGRLVIEQERRSQTFRTWSEACGSTAAPDSDNCGPRLWAVLKAPGQPLSRRAEAGAALIARGDPEAAGALSEILKPIAPAVLAPLAPIVATMPAARAVPLLVRLSESSSTADQSAACRELGGFDKPEARAALAKVVAASAPGTEPWLLCQISRGRLREPDIPPGAIAGYGHTLQGDGLMFAAQTMAANGDDSARQVLTDLTHRGSFLSRVTAADLLIPLDRDAAIPIIEAGERDGDPQTRAKALDAERRLRRDPPAQVRRMLLDIDEVVRIRAAEVVLDNAQRAQTR
jgi:hypothetical protein